MSNKDKTSIVGKIGRFFSLWSCICKDCDWFHDGKCTESNSEKYKKYVDKNDTCSEWGTW